MNRLAPFSVRLCLLIVLASALAACNPQNTETPSPTDQLVPQAGTLTPTPESPPVLPADTPTPTAAVQIPVKPTLAPTSDTSGPKEIELRFTDPLTQQECVTHFPFEVLEDADRSIRGKGVIDCKFEVQQCAQSICITYHSTYAMPADLSGFVRPSTPSFPNGMLEAYLNGTFTMTQYWTDIPPETVMAYTEANPFVASSSDIIPLAFQYQDGATTEIGGEGGSAEFPWVFTLHLK